MYTYTMSDDVQTVRDALTKGQRDSQLLADVRGTLRDFNEAPWDEAHAALARLAAERVIEVEKPTPGQAKYALSHDACAAAGGAADTTG